MDYLSFVVLALHVICAAALIGGAIAWRLAVGAGAGNVIAAWRPVAMGSIGILLLTGIYNLLHRPVQTKEFHILFGIKMLLALHVFAVTAIATRAADNPRRSRQLTGIVISGLLILIISAAFRWV